jgi:hypothetical protein|nr:N-6 DNA methylase [Lautropia mirabilis]
MKRTRKTEAALSLPATLTLEGGLFLPDQLQKATQGLASAQQDADYRLPKGLKAKDEYSRAFQIACAQWQDFAQQLERRDIDATQLTTRFVQELLRDAFGYNLSPQTQPQEVDGRHYPVSFLAGNLPILVAPHTLGLDDADTSMAIEGSGRRRKTPFQAMQELLNASEPLQWGIVSNGRQLRLLRDAASLTRPSFLEIDLADLLGSKRYAEFANVWRLLHASRASTDAQRTSCVWERWRHEGQQEGTRVRDGLRNGVEKALLTLGEGFLQHPSNDNLRAALDSGQLSRDAYFQQLLRLVYRLIFVFTVEERGVLHPQWNDPETKAARRAYAEGYALARLRNFSLKRRPRNRHDDQWQAIRIVFRGLDQGEPRLALPALGGLFAASQCKDLDAASLDNAHLLEALKELRWARLPGSGSLIPVDYRNMGPEELGSVYESLLELVPTVDVHARSFDFVGRTDAASTAGNARKLTGSYYTPDSLVQELIRSALEPVIEQRLAANPVDPDKAILAIRVIDPACGSGHFLLAAARRLAERLALLRSYLYGLPGSILPGDYRHALREVVAHCIYGVDRNPMAVELARMALWLEGFEEGRPLDFLDHHLQVGDALLGLTDLDALTRGISKDAFKPLSGDDREVCKALTKTNAVALKQLTKDLQSQQMLLGMDNASGLQAMRAIEDMPTNTPEQVSIKETRWLAFMQTAAQSPLAQAADVVVGAFLLSKTTDRGATVPTSATLHTLLTTPNDITGPAADAVAAARAACAEARVLHWPLAFPQVFARGGFDCVLGNPPWEVNQMGEEEFFASRDPNIAALAGDSRKKAIESLSKTSPRLWEEFSETSRRIAATNIFFRESGRFPLTAVGKLNTYPLFAETILQIHARDGRAGFIVPTGIATDDSTKAYFGHITQSKQLVSLYDIENREAVFPSVHRSYKFCLLTLGASEQAEFVCFATQVSQLSDERRRFTLTPEDFRLINPNTLTCPVFRSKRDAELTKKLYRAAPVLIYEANAEDNSANAGELPAENPWGITFSQGLFNMTSASHLFKDEESPNHLPLYEAKLIHHFDHRWATYTTDPNTGTVASRDVTLQEKQDASFSITPRYWVPAREVWLRLADLPDELMRALKADDGHATVLAVTKVLFGRHLTALREKAPGTAALAAWESFVDLHAYAKDIDPEELGVKPLKKNAGGRLDEGLPLPVQQLLRLADEASNLPMPPAGLSSEESAQRLAERWLEESCPKWLMGWRDICRATDERTVIASVLPTVGVGHTMPLLTTVWDARQTSALLGNLCSLVLDFCARVKIGGTHLTYSYLKQFPVIPPERYTEPDLDFITPRILELTYTAKDMAPWATALISGWKLDNGNWKPGTPEPIRRSPLVPFPFDQERRAVLRAELDAYYARLYGLDRDELRYILDPEDVMGKDYPSETFRVLKDREIREYGEYRTQRLVLEAWDRQHT